MSATWSCDVCGAPVLGSICPVDDEEHRTAYSRPVRMHAALVECAEAAKVCESFFRGLFDAGPYRAPECLDGLRAALAALDETEAPRDDA